MLFSSGFWHMWDTVPPPSPDIHIYRILCVHVSSRVRFPVWHWRVSLPRLKKKNKKFGLKNRLKNIFAIFDAFVLDGLTGKWWCWTAGCMISSIPGIGVASRSRHFVDGYRALSLIYIRTAAYPYKYSFRLLYLIISDSSCVCARHGKLAFYFFPFLRLL